MKILITITRIIMGLLFMVASLGYFFKLMPQQQLSTDAMQFITGMVASGYLLPVLKTFELLCAIAFLSGRFVPLAAVVIFPITLNVVLYHAFLTPEGLLIPVVLLFGNVLLAFHHRAKYQPILAMN